MKKSSKLAAVSFAALVATGGVFAANVPLGIPDPNSRTANLPSDKRPVITPQSIVFGAYDPHGDFGQDSNSKIEHLFLPWEDVELGTLAVADEYALQRGRELMITIEPWSWAVDWRVSSEELYAGISAGRYDSNMAAVCSEIAKLKSPITIRWAQEMDETDNQFTWAHWTGPQYIEAYRRAITVCRQHIPNATFIWSPKGNEGLEAFYPGDEYVDIIGLSVFGYQPYDNFEQGRDLTFAERLAPGYERVLGFGKPIIVAELGYEGDQNYVRRWAEDVTRPHTEFSELTTVVYFNDREVYPWPNDHGRPDWRVIREVVN